MSLILGVAGAPLGSALLIRGWTRASTALLVVGAITVATSVGALATGLRGVRAWQLAEPLPAAWYWPGIAAGVLQGTVFAGGLALGYFLGGGPLASVELWLVAVTMLALGGIPYLGALCCAGAWWVGRDRPDGAVLPDVR